MKKTALIALLSCTAFAFSLTTYAAEEPASAAPATVEEAPAVPAVEPEPQPKEPLSPEMQKKAEQHKEAAKKASEAVNEIGKDLKGDDARHFFMLYNNYNLLATVKMVQSDVGNAVTSCGEKNPDLKSKMDERFTTWNKAIGDVVTEAQGNVGNMISAQEYSEPGKIKNAFKLLDEAREASNKYIDKQPVTTEDACNHLLTKMDSTQKNLTELLRRTLMSYARSTSGKTGADKAAMPGSAEPEKTEAAKSE